MCTSLPRMLKFGTRASEELGHTLTSASLFLRGGLVWMCFCPGSFGALEKPCLVPHWVQLRRSTRIIHVIRA